jgi:hypothetical protein
MYAHIRAAGLVAKYYALGADPQTAQVSTSRERTLGEWLSFAEDQSRRNIGRLQSRKIDATPSAQLYEIARIKARRDVPQKVEALIEFWSADLHAQVLRRIAGPGEP